MAPLQVWCSTVDVICLWTINIELRSMKPLLCIRVDQQKLSLKHTRQYVESDNAGNFTIYHVTTLTCDLRCADAITHAWPQSRRPWCVVKIQVFKTKNVGGALVELYSLAFFCLWMIIKQNTSKQNTAMPGHQKWIERVVDKSSI